jgi:GT2 family glycosyltransferase
MVYIILVNWNGWQDTVECLESLFRLKYDAYRVIVCDNGSTDGSVEHMKAWANGQLDIHVPLHNPLRSLTFPPVRKPLPICEADAPAIYNLNNEAPLVIIRSARNLGFAGGNNLGLRYALNFPDMQFAWLLNNDTVVDPGSLTALLRRLSEVPEAGICGSTVRYYDRPDHAQLLGGAALNVWRGCATPIGEGTREDTAPDQDAVEREMDYVYGACTLVTRAFLEQVGLLNEAYFMYAEEIDWARRSGNRFKMAYAPNSIVYHRGGSSSGGTGVLPNYHFTRSWLIFARRYHFALLPIVLLLVFRRIVKAFLNGKPEIGAAIARGARDGLLQG